MKKEDIHIFKSTISSLAKLSSASFLILLISLMYSLEISQLNENLFVVTFVGSLILFIIYYPWIQKRTLVISSSEIRLEEIIGLGLNFNEIIIPTLEIISTRQMKDVLILKTVKDTYRIKAHLFMHPETRKRVLTSEIKDIIDNMRDPFQK